MDKEIISNYINRQFNTDCLWQIKTVPAGASNLTYTVTAGNASYILRTSPPGTKSRGSHNMKREFDWQKALYPVFSLCPEVIIYCDDQNVFDRPFYLMKPINGTIIRDQLPKQYNDRDIPILCQNLIETHIKLHRTSTHSLQQFGKGPGYIARQISGWTDRYNKVKPDDQLAQNISQWLFKNSEIERPLCPIHNDFKFDNVVFNGTEIIGVLDWELATIGDPLLDLGCSLAYWVESADSCEMKKIAMMPTHLKSMWSREQLVNYYCQLTGLQLDDFQFYYIFGLFRLAVIAQQIFHRYQLGQNHNPKFAHLGYIRDLMLKQAKEYIP